MYDKKSRDKRNLWLLKQYFFHYSPLLAAVSLMDGACRRMGWNELYKKTSRKRAEVCKKYIIKKYGSIIDKYEDMNGGYM